ncbi:MAG: MFS transporter, partial [Leifsonia sp.]|nr:MFS transporter [Leifsonia sp.]
SAAGVLLGGVLTTGFGWSSVFFVNVPVGIQVLVAIPLLITRDRRGTAERMDAAGAATATLGLAAAVAALSEGGTRGWTSQIVLGLGVAALALLTAFVLIERRAAHPLLPFAFFRNRDALAGNTVMLLVGGSTVALFFALSVYLQEVLHLDALSAGLSQLPLALALVGIGVVWFALAGGTGFVAGFVLPTIVIGLGLGATFVTATQLAVRGVAESDSGLASGLVNTAQQIGGALGLAVLGGIASAQTAALLAAGSGATAATAGGFLLLFLGVALLALIGAAVTALVRSR